MSGGTQAETLREMIIRNFLLDYSTQVVEAIRVLLNEVPLNPEKAWKHYVRSIDSLAKLYAKKITEGGDHAGQIN